MRNVVFALFLSLIATTATAQTAQFPNVNVRTNCAIGGTNFVGNLLVTNSVTVGNNVTYSAASSIADVIDMDAAFVEATVAGAITLAHATNGATTTLKSAVKAYYNPSGSDQTLTIPATWRTNAFSAVPTKLTNGWITILRLTSLGATATAATQTNCYVTFGYFH